MLQSPLIENVELSRHTASQQLDPQLRSTYGQYMTPSSIAQFMAAMFSEEYPTDIRVLDPGAGVGSLTAAFVNEFSKRTGVNTINATAYEIDHLLIAFLKATLTEATKKHQLKRLSISTRLRTEDFVTACSVLLNEDLFTSALSLRFTHAIINPPYRKISAKSDHRQQLRSVGIETTNLYTAFASLAIRLLEPSGELVAIIPRSFCNGLYFRPFRQMLLEETFIRQIHTFEQRNQAFKDDEVLQENIIIHLQKKGDPPHGNPGTVRISSSRGSDFTYDERTGQFTAEDMIVRNVNYNSVINSTDPERFIHVATCGLDQLVADRMAAYSNSLSELMLEVSTGPVVDFRMKNDLLDNIEVGTMQSAAPLLYPQHFKDNRLTWPVEGKKPNAIRVSEDSQRWLWPNRDYYVVTKRFTTKEEKKRIVASVYDAREIDSEYVGFENHLNVFHWTKCGLPAALAHGLAVFLNSSLVDKYFRQFSGHTQVNSTDLKALKYPERSTLIRWGELALQRQLLQVDIDELIKQESEQMAEFSEIDPIQAQQKIDQALSILKDLGLPRAQQNERSALTLLALLDLKPHQEWSNIERPLIGITPVMEFCRDYYGKQYAPNTRETFRRQTMHQFLSAAIVLYNPDDPGRAVNSPKACYQISPAAFDVMVQFGRQEWKKALEDFEKDQQSLATQYAKERVMNMVPVTVAEGKSIDLTPGVHSQLIRDIIEEFGPRFAPGSEVIYVGDTGEKEVYFLRNRLQELGVTVDRHGKMPDVVLYFVKKDWLLLIESVTSHGPVDSKRHEELANLFAQAKPGLVYVTAFPTRSLMSRYLSEISWETEVWVAEAPTHMIHFNGERFLGPYKNGEV